MPIIDLQNPQKVDRRWMLKLSMLGVAGVATAGWWSWHRGVLVSNRGKAFSPWEEWKTNADPQLRLVSAAVLAPSKHNTQPWQFRVDPGAIDFFIEANRNVGSMDPLRHEAYFSAGCALTNLLLAASAEGYSPKVTYMPDKELDTWIAKVELQPGTKVTPRLYEAIPERHTNRGPYDAARPLPASAIAEMNREAVSEGVLPPVWITDPAKRKEFATLTVDATREIIADDEQARDSAAWYRPAYPDVRRLADGMSLESLSVPTGRRLADEFFVAPSQQELNENWLAQTRDVQVATAPAFVILTVCDGGNPIEAIRAGQAWQRMALAATAQGIAMQPLTQTIERNDRERQLGGEARIGRQLRALAANGGEPVFAFRVGYAKAEPAISPRRGVEEVVFKKVERPKPSDQA